MQNFDMITLCSKEIWSIAAFLLFSFLWPVFANPIRFNGKCTRLNYIWIAVNNYAHGKQKTIKSRPQFVASIPAFTRFEPNRAYSTKLSKHNIKLAKRATIPILLQCNHVVGLILFVLQPQPSNRSAPLEKYKDSPIPMSYFAETCSQYWYSQNLHP